MAFHLGKGKIIRVPRLKNPIVFQFQLKGHILEAADTKKNLGVDLCGGLHQKHHVDRIVKKTNSMFGILKRKEISSQETKTAAFNIIIVRDNTEVQIKCDVRL